MVNHLIKSILSPCSKVYQGTTPFKVAARILRLKGKTGLSISAGAGSLLQRLQSFCLNYDVLQHNQPCWCQLSVSGRHRHDNQWCIHKLQKDVPVPIHFLVNLPHPNSLLRSKSSGHRALLVRWGHASPYEVLTNSISRGSSVWWESPHQKYICWVE